MGGVGRVQPVEGLGRLLVVPTLLAGSVLVQRFQPGSGLGGVSIVSITIQRCVVPVGPFRHRRFIEKAVVTTEQV